MPEDIVLVRQLALDRQGLLRTPADPVRAGMSTFFDFGGAFAIQIIFVVATVAPAPPTAGSVSRCRITGISFFNGSGAGTNLAIFHDGGAGGANRIYTQLVVGTSANLFVGPANLPPGGILITTDFRVTGTRNNLELTVFYTAEYDLVSMG